MFNKNISIVTDDNRICSFAELLAKFNLFLCRIQKRLSDAFSANIYSCCRLRIYVFRKGISLWFLAQRTNGRAYASVSSVCLSSVCDVMYCG